MPRSKFDRLIFVDEPEGGIPAAAALELAVAAAKPGDNLVYAAAVENLKGRQPMAKKALDLAERGLISLTTMKAQKNPPLWHYIAQRSGRKYEKKGSGK